MKFRIHNSPFIIAVLLLLVPGAWPMAPAMAQQPSSTAAIFASNSQYLQGRTWADYKASAGSGLTLNVAAGQVWCQGTHVNYAGGALTMDDDATNYVYLDTASSCAPDSNTTGLTATMIPVATVVTSSGAISTITDTRSLVSASGGESASFTHYAHLSAGADASAKIIACLAAVVSAGGAICDARGITGAQAIGTKIEVPANVTLLLGDAQFSTTLLPAVTWNQGSSIIGTRNPGAATTVGTSILYTGSAAGSVMERESGYVYHVTLADFSITHTQAKSHDGSIGISTDSIYQSTVSDVAIYSFDYNWKIAGTAAGSYYNDFYHVVGTDAYTYDFWFAYFSNSNRLYSPQCHSTGAGSTDTCFFFDADSAQNLIDAPNIENASVGIYLNGRSHTVRDGYQEVVTSPIIIDADAQFMTVTGGIGMCVTDNSGSRASHIVMSPGCSGTAPGTFHKEYYPKLFGATYMNIGGGGFFADFNPGGDAKPSVEEIGWITGSPTGLVRTSNVVTGTFGNVSVAPKVGQKIIILGSTAVGATDFNGTFYICGPPTAGCIAPNYYSATWAQTAADDTGGGGTAQFLYAFTAYQFVLPGLNGYSPQKIMSGPANANNSVHFLPAYNGDGAVWMAGLSGATNEGSFTLSQITAPNVTVVPTNGAATTWGYKFVANDSYGSTAGSAEGTTAAGAADLTVTDYNTVYPSTLPTTLSLDVYRTTAGGTCRGGVCTNGKIGSISGSALQNPTGLSFVDTGMAGDGASTPATNTTGKLQAQFVNAVAGFRVNNAATLNNCLVGDGTNFVDSACPGGGAPAAHNLLSASHGDTAAASVVRGDLMIGVNAAPNTVWYRLPKGNENQVLVMGALQPWWSSVALSQAAAVSGILGSTNGGTGNGFTKFIGPATAEKTFTLPDASISLSGVVYAQTADVTVANTTSETTVLGSGVGTLTLPADVLTAGRTLRGTLRGYLNAAGNPTLLLKVYLGAVAVYTGPSLAIAPDTDSAFTMMFDVTCRTAGSSGTVQSQANTLYITDEGGIKYSVPLDVAQTSTVVVNTTTTNVIDVKATWGTADAGNTITVTNAVFELIGG